MMSKVSLVRCELFVLRCNGVMMCGEIMLH